MLAGQQEGCEPVGDVRFICGLIGPEDLAVVPGGERVVASGNQEGGRIHLIDVADKTTSVLFPTADRTERLDTEAYPSCPGPLDAAELGQDEFRAHGLYLRPGTGGVHALYVVHHGRRESIEVFELDAGAAPVTLAWIGCAVAPEGLRLNSVVALPEGGFAATSTSTGDVWEWSTAGGWSVIPGTDDTTPNGLEISPDGRWLYVAGWRGEKLTRLSRGRTPRQKDVVPVGFRPDNLRFVDGGASILAAGHGDYGTPEETSNVAVIDPRTLEVRRIFRHPRIDGFAASTAAIRVGSEIWLGTNRGRMVAYFPVPELPPLLTSQEPAAGDGVPPRFAPVTWERLLAAADEPHNWLMYNGTLDGQRFSRLDRINRTNVADLELKWAYNIRQLDRAETTPLVVDGVMFITESPSNVTAVDATTGRPWWRYEHPLPDDLRICCGRNNRGVAILGETLYMSTLDAHLVAIDARSGHVVWDAEVADYRSGYSKTAAPLVVKDRVVTGIAGGEFGIRGFLDSYDAETGERTWRTWTIPGPDHPDNRTWAGDSWRTGGSPTWITGSYDPELNLVYWGTGNPGPDWNGEVREGDNLYADSVLALDGDTGEMRWYFQFTPHDVHDWDAIQIPVLADVEMNGAPRKAMLWANRNAFYYTLDRETGEFLLGKPFALQTWAEGLDENGRPIRLPDTFPTPDGTVVAPPAGGGTNWWSPAYSPRTGLLYVNAFDGEGEYFIRDEEYEEGERYTGGGVQSPQPMDNYRSAIRAIDPATGDVRWEFEMKPRARTGVLATAGDLVFGATVDGWFFALDAESGEELWRIPLGGPVNANPMTYAVGGAQYVTMAVGNTVYTFGLDE